MSRYSPAMVVGAAFLDEAFAHALLTDPCHALARANIQLSVDELAPFTLGVATVADLAREVYAWELATGRAEPPLRVPALEPRRRRVEPSITLITKEHEAALAA
jgi:hypothetical protein